MKQYIQKQPIHAVTYNLATPPPPFHLDFRCAGGEAMVCSLVVPGGSSLYWQQSSRARVDCWTTASWVSVTLLLYCIQLVMLYGIAHLYIDVYKRRILEVCLFYFFIFFILFLYVSKTYSLSLSISDGLGKEVITRLDTSIKTSQYFYTDSNGRELLQRK